MPCDEWLVQIHVSAPPGFQMAQAPLGRQQHPPQRMQLQIADCAHNSGLDSDLGAMLRNPNGGSMGGKPGSRHPHLASLLAGSHGQRNSGGRLSAGSSRTNSYHDKVLEPSHAGKLPDNWDTELG